MRPSHFARTRVLLDPSTINCRSSPRATMSILNKNLISTEVCARESPAPLLILSTVQPTSFSCAIQTIALHTISNVFLWGFSVVAIPYTNYFGVPGYPSNNAGALGMQAMQPFSFPLQPDLFVILAYCNTATIHYPSPTPTLTPHPSPSTRPSSADGAIQNTGSTPVWLFTPPAAYGRSTWGSPSASPTIAGQVRMLARLGAPRNSIPHIQTHASLPVTRRPPPPPRPTRSTWIWVATLCTRCAVAPPGCVWMVNKLNHPHPHPTRTRTRTHTRTDDQHCLRHRVHHRRGDPGRPRGHQHHHQPPPQHDAVAEGHRLLRDGEDDV